MVPMCLYMDQPKNRFYFSGGMVGVFFLANLISIFNLTFSSITTDFVFAVNVCSFLAYPNLLARPRASTWC